MLPDPLLPFLVVEVVLLLFVGVDVAVVAVVGACSILPIENKMIIIQGNLMKKRKLNWIRTLYVYCFDTSKL